MTPEKYFPWKAIMGQQPVLYYTVVMGLGVTSIQDHISTAYWYLMVSLEVHCT